MDARGWEELIYRPMREYVALARAVDEVFDEPADEPFVPIPGRPYHNPRSGPRPRLTGPTGPPLACSVCGDPQDGTIYVRRDGRGPQRVTCPACVTARSRDDERETPEWRAEFARQREAELGMYRVAPPCASCGRLRRSWFGHVLNRACCEPCERETKREARRRSRHREPVEHVLICEHCGCLFTAHRADARYCSGAHRVAAHRARERDV
jgi:hypothetical protein